MSIRFLKICKFGTTVNYKCISYCTLSMRIQGLVLKTLQHFCAIQSLRPTIFMQQKRFRGKINIQKPRAPHHARGIVERFVTPFIANPDSVKPWKERCSNRPDQRVTTTREAHPYEIIIARECHNWFKSSNMVAIFHTNSILAEDQFDFAVALKRANMYLKGFQPFILQLALKDTIYEPSLKLMQRGTRTLFAFSPDAKTDKLPKILKKTPQVILLAGILHGKFLDHDEFLKMGKLDLVTAQAGLVHVLRTAAGGNLNQQLTHHQSTLVTRLKQIGTNNEDKPCDVKE